MRRLLSIFIAGTLAVAASYSSAQEDTRLKVTARFDRTAIDPVETVTLSLTVESEENVDIQSPTLPPIGDFEVLSQWQSSSTQASLVTSPQGRPQFKTVRKKVFNWQLSPKRLGDLTIAPIEVVIDGRNHRTQALSLEVASGAGNRPQPRGQARPGQGFGSEEGDGGEEDDLFAQLLKRGMGQVPRGGTRTMPVNPKEAFFIQVETDKTEAFVGEQITVSFYLYTTGVIRDLDTLKYPSLKGFWKEDIEIATHLNFQQEVIDGVAYKKALLASFALFPIKEGTSVIDSYQAKCTVIPGNDPFGALGMGRAFTFTKASQPVKITVKPIPNEGRPADYSGAVGDFQVTARVEDANPKTNQPFPLKIRFEGRGNAKLIDIPAVQLPDGLELYDKQQEAKFFGWGTSFKEFTLLLIPRRAGEFVIPAIGASMFDPQAKKYVSRATEPLRVIVGEGANQAGSSQSFTGGAENSGAGASTAAKPSGPVAPVFKDVFVPTERWTLSQAVAATIGTHAMALLVLLFVAYRELGWGQGKPRLSRLIRLRVRDIETSAKKGDARSVGIQGVNLLAFTLEEVVGDRVFEREIRKLLAATPPTIRKECGPALEEAYTTFELLAFAPDAAVADWKNAEKLRALVQKTAKTLGRMVALSGSDERST
ncbi:MAG: BatD family protein [Bdellovibrionales bacterium]|jgi:hypothetical protein|nr:BatD family protein [Bdellovibrionales bacterium]